MTRNVYVIEDDDKNMKVFKAIFKLIYDIEIYAETQGDTGFELIKSSNPDLIILDIWLPGSKGRIHRSMGIDMCKELRKIEKFKDIPIIAVTALAMKGDEERIMAAGFDNYISKPIRVSEFKELVKSPLF